MLHNEYFGARVFSCFNALTSWTEKATGRRRAVFMLVTWSQMLTHTVQVAAINPQRVSPPPRSSEELAGAKVQSSHYTRAIASTTGTLHRTRETPAGQGGKCRQPRDQIAQSRHRMVMFLSLFLIC